MQDFRQEGAPADIGVFEFPAAAMVFQFSFSGVNYTCAIRSGVSGWVLISPPIVSGATDDVPIQATLDYLTAGRTWQERVILIGDFVISSPLLVPSYLHLQLFGTVTLAADSDCDMLRNENFATGADIWITVQGGYWDGNGANQANGYGFNFEGPDPGTLSYIEILDVDIINPKDTGCRWDRVSWSNISDLRTQDPGLDGLTLEIVSDGIFENLNLYGSGVGLRILYNTACHFSDVYLHGSSSGPSAPENAQLYMFGSSKNDFINLRVDNTSVNGIVLEGADYGPCWGNQFTNVEVTQCIGAANTFDAIVLSGLSDPGVYSNTFVNVYVEEDTGNTWRHGVNMIRAYFNRFHAFILKDCQTTGFYLDENCGNNAIEGNTIHDAATGVNVTAATCNGNTVKNNKYIGVTTPCIDNGTDTILATREIQLIQGTTFISTAGEAWGWSITADTNFALGIGWLPPEVQQVVRIRVIGVALAAPGAGDYMRIQITGEGATFAEDFATEPIDVVDHNNEEVNVAIDEAVNWIFTATDDADIGHLLGGDRLQIKVLHEGAGNGDAETNAIVDTIQAEFV